MRNRNGCDTDSIIEDPMFADAGQHDYRLTENSHAFALGIEAIDAFEIGLLPDYRFGR